MSTVRRNFLISLASSNAIMVINFVASLFLARLLTPHEIGIYSVAYVFAGLLRTIREMGLGSYIVQESELTTDRMRTAFGISLLIAAITGLIVAAAANYAGDFYREPGISQVLYLIAASFILVPFGSTSMSLLRRNLRFKEIAVIDTLGTILQNTAAILLAWYGFSYMSLAWSSLIGLVGTILLVMLHRPPQLPWLPSLKEWRRILHFSSYVSGSALVNYANVSASDLVLGRMLSMESVALFNRANSLSELIAPIILRASNAVSLPYFSQQNRDGDSVLPGFVHATTLITIFSVPICVVLAIVAEPLVLVLFGPQWTTSAPLLQILCLGAIFRTPALLTNQVMTALAAVKRQFVLDLQSLAIRLVAVIACAPYGLKAVAWGYCASILVTSFLRLAALRKLTGIRRRSVATTFLPCLLPTLVSAAGPLAITMFVDLGPYLTTAACGLAAAAGWLVAVLAVPNPMRSEVQLIFRKITKQPVSA